MYALTSRLSVLAIALAASACGLISDDVADFPIDLDKSFQINTGSYQIDQNAAMTATQTSCAAMPQACDAAAMAACPDDCSGRCAASNTCEIDIDVSLYQMVDLLTDQASLRSLDGRAFIEVEIDTLTYVVTANTLNVATPEMQVFIAPMSVMETTDAQAKLIGTIPAIQPGSINTEEKEIVFSPTGRADLITVMSSFKTPFNILVGATLTVSNGTPVPMGTLDAKVRIKGHAGI